MMLMTALAEKDRRIIKKAYEFADLTGYPWHRRWLIYAADLIFFLLISVIGKTLRFEVRGMEHFERFRLAGQLPIQCFWHGSIFPATYYFRHRRLIVMTSQSFDGEYIARFIQRFGYGVVRGSSTRGGVGALVEQIRLMKLGCPAGFAIDGPKGPRHVVKEGALLLARKTGNPIVPFALTPRASWTIKSWDKMEIPYPFTKVLIEIAPPIYVSSAADAAEIAVKRHELQTVLDNLTQRGKAQQQAFLQKALD